ncbi:hypothetical protein DM02DRAFT_240744 [Periconia macrospinosa]|uniref:Rhodopsin domain-containing protein n=1 Tax=Periconia macrospinosa TaxID=97972 RepID=A0A2V1DZP7_9PLEO|nr:hypothetical protein DM02DRAFT_240744 [Periconia macrospinosa]
MSGPDPAFLAHQLSVQHQTRQPNLYAAVSVSLFIAYVSVVLRLIARYRMGQKLLADDYWIIGALFPVTVFDGFNYWSTHAGLGLHIIRIKSIKALIQSSVACMATYPLCLPPSKFSILYLYHRLFPSKAIKHISLLIAFVVLGSAIAASVAFGLQCIPLSSLWTGAPNRCLNLSALSMATGVLNIVTDVAILCLPIQPLTQLQVSTKTRIGVLATFLLGGCVCIISIIRTTVVGQASQEDPSWNNAIGGIWSTIEVHVAIVSANLPVLKPIFMRDSTETSSSHTPASRKPYFHSPTIRYGRMMTSYRCKTLTT